MKQRSSGKGKKSGKSKPPARGSKRNSPGYVLLALSVPLLLSACAGTPPRPECWHPLPNPDLMQEPPPEGYFRQNLDRILDPSFTGQPTEPTS